MFPVILAWAAYLFLSFQIITHKIKIADFVTSVIIIIVAFFVLFFWSIHHITKPNGAKRAAAPAAAQKPTVKSHQYTSDIVQFEFKAAGTTFENDDGTDRQTILRHLKFRDAPYATEDEDLDVDIRETIFEGETALEIYINNYMIGYVPKNKIHQVLEGLENISSFTIDSVKITGGGRTEDGERKSYGCVISVSYLK